MLRRRGRPSLIGTMARTAVITGTATATMGVVGKSMAPSAPAHPQAGGAQTAAPVAAPEPAVGFGADTIAKLKDLGELRTAGVLTDQEFAQAKAKLLG
jgi:hypothetical protein